MKKTLGDNLNGDDYFLDIYKPLVMDDWELEGFMQRVFKVLTMILMEQGNVH